ncbi:MAG TPA: class I SAM-dependent methyltransferase [Methanoregulaceae archaeon]|nr:class I SAM-dependent methyltransferase [Methanoregulaceae archaeon]HQJ88090.1 class I SAM-dependent methyltransferase [Methanoregulaceae archaeon]
MKAYDDAERRRWQDPEAVLDAVGVPPGGTVADVGAGDGYFTLPIARRVGPRGVVYAVDPSVERLTRLHERAEEEGLENIRIRAVPAEEIAVCEGCADLVFYGNCLHDFADPAVALRNAMTALRPGGRLASIDWKKEETLSGRDPIGPPVEIRFGEEEAAGLIRGAGFSVGAIAPFGPYHYLILATRP